MSDEKESKGDSEIQSESKSEAVAEESPTDKLQKELEKAKSDYLYLRADFDNFRRRTQKEREDLLKFGSERALKDLLDVVDNVDRALNFEVTPETLDSFKKGVSMIASDLKNLLNKYGVAEVPSQGEPFNPQFHEALGAEDSETIAAGSITKVFRKAYKMHEKVIRTGQVIIANEKTAPKNEES